MTELVKIPAEAKEIIKHKRTLKVYANKAEFGSDKWVRAIQASYVLWPKEDRRQQDRRITSRRTLERRDQLQRFRGMSLRQRMLKKQRQTQVLTAEERAMLKDLHNHF